MLPCGYKKQRKFAEIFKIHSVYFPLEYRRNKKRYADEVKERWGMTSAYTESEKKMDSYNEEQWKDLSGEGEAILEEFAECRQLPPTSEKVQTLVRKWQDYISANFYNCTDEILLCLGIMYIEDERFTTNIDRKGKGTAEFMAEAIRVYCGR